MVVGRAKENNLLFSQFPTYVTIGDPFDVAPTSGPAQVNGITLPNLKGSRQFWSEDSCNGRFWSGSSTCGFTTRDLDGKGCFALGRQYPWSLGFRTRTVLALLIEGEVDEDLRCKESSSLRSRLLFPTSMSLRWTSRNESFRSGIGLDSETFQNANKIRQNNIMIMNWSLRKKEKWDA